MDLRPLLVLVAAIAAVAAGLPLEAARPAYADGEIDVRVVAVDDAAFPTVTAVFTADIGGTPLAAVTADSIRVVESGEPATVEAVTSVTDADIPIALVVAVDLSGSMAGEPLVRARDAVAALINGLGPADTVAVMTFADDVRLLQPFTPDKVAAASALTSLTATGNTALYDAVAEAAELAGSTEQSRRAVVLVSDGENFGVEPVVGREGSLQTAGAAGVPFYVIGLGAEIDRAYLEELAAITGGRFFDAPLPADVPAIYAAIEALLRSQFVVTVTSLAPPEPTLREIIVEIQTPEGAGRGSLTYRSLRPAPLATARATAVPPTPVPAATATPTRAAAPSAAPAEGNGGLAWPLTLAGLALVLPGITLLVVLWRRRPAPVDDTEPSAAGAPLPRPIAAERERLPPRPSGTLRVQRGRRTLSLDLPPHPVTVGAGESCWLRLHRAEGVAPEHFRLWWRDGHPMLHHVAAGYQTFVNGHPVIWASLRDGDEIAIGTAVLTFHALPAEDSQAK